MEHDILSLSTPSPRSDLLEQRAARDRSGRAITSLADGEEEAGAGSFAEFAQGARGVAAWLTEVGLAGQLGERVESGAPAAMGDRARRRGHCTGG